MFKTLKIIIKLSYIALSALFITRLFLKFNGIHTGVPDYAYISKPVYFLTDIINFPVSFVFNSINPFLPESIQAYFPEFFIRQTGGLLEFSSLTTLALCVLIGCILEYYVTKLIDYENAFISIGKNAKSYKHQKAHRLTADNSSGSSSKTSHDKSDITSKDRVKRNIENLKKEIVNEKASKRKDNALKEAYNLIIKRLDREKAELVNKNIQLEKEIITDTLTKLRTRKYMNERLKNEFSFAKLRNHYLSVIMLDIDHFKNINDTLGHQIGDQVLQQVSNIILDACTKNIVAARYGGEEIVIIGTKLSSEQAKNLAESIRRKIESRVRAGSNENIKSITISAGVATLKSKDNINSPEELIERADIALYEAKNDGRNNVKVYQN
ncbi:MAG: GGDEF domain-containing protein [Cyanobacteriota bacterium]